MGAAGGIPISEKIGKTNIAGEGSTPLHRDMSLIRKLFEFVRPPNERERLVALVWFVDNPTMNLEPIEPETAVELYLDDKKLEAGKSTVRSHRSRLGNFVRCCDKQDIINCNELIGRLVHQYRVWRRNDGELNPVSVKTEMDTLRVFIRWLGTIDGVDPELHHKVRSPDVTPDQNSRSVMLDEEAAEQMLAYLEKFEYATRQHVVLSLLCLRLSCPVPVGEGPTRVVEEIAISRTGFSNRLVSQYLVARGE